MKKTALFLIVLALASCSGGSSGSSGLKPPDPNEITQKLASLAFNPSSFSQHIFFTADKKYVRLAYSFFPDGTKFNSGSKLATIPCDFLNTIPEGVDVQLTAPLKPCEKPFELHFESEEAAFTLNGIVAPVDLAAKIFSTDFGFEVTVDGIKAVGDQSVLTAPNGKLEEYYQATKNQ